MTNPLLGYWLFNPKVPISISDLGYRQEEVLNQRIIFNFIHHGDHARLRVNLEPDTWRTWKKLPQSSGGRQGFDRSKVFNLRFRVNNEPLMETLEERQQRQVN